MPAGTTTGADQFDILPLVKDVDVDEGQTVGGQAAVKITGVLDAGSFQAGFMAGLPADVGVDASFDDTRVVVYLSESSKLPLRMLIDQSMQVEGEELTLSMDLALVNADEPVEIPEPRRVGRPLYTRRRGETPRRARSADADLHPGR